MQRLEEIRAGDPTGYWVPGQFDNADNVEAHYRTTGPEIWEQSGGIVGAFVASQGSGGTLTGVGRFLRERDSRVRLYAVEPEECALLARREWGPHGIEGIGDGFIPENLDVALLSGVITTTTAESLAMARRLASEEGIFCGISTGCNVAAALKLARHRPDLPSIVTMANDTGQRYFTTALCGEDKHVEVPEREHPMDPRTRRELDLYQPKWEILTLKPAEYDFVAARHRIEAKAKSAAEKLTSLEDAAARVKDGDHDRRRRLPVLAHAPGAHARDPPAAPPRRSRSRGISRATRASSSWRPARRAAS